MRKLVLVLCSTLVVPVCAQARAAAPARAPAEPGYGPNVLEGQTPARRTVAGAATPLPGLPKEAAAYRLRVTGASTTMTGTLQVCVRNGRATVRVEAVTDARGAVGLDLTVRGEIVTVERGGSTRAGRPHDSVPEGEGVVVWAEDGQFRLDSVQWCPLQEPEPKATPGAGKPPAKADPAERLTVGSKWRGRFTGIGPAQRCTIVVLAVSRDALTFRLELETGAHFRIACARKLGQLAVQEIVHTKAASNGRKRVIREEKGSGRVNAKELSLSYSFRSELPNRNETVSGNIQVTLS